MAAGARGRHNPRSVPGRTLPGAWPRPESEPATTVQRNPQGPHPAATQPRLLQSHFPRNRRPGLAFQVQVGWVRVGQGTQVWGPRIRVGVMRCITPRSLREEKDHEVFLD